MDLANKIAVIFSLSILWTYVIEPGEILGFIGKWFDKFKDDLYNSAWWTKPLGACNVCFNFWLSVVFVLAFQVFSFDAVLIIGMNHILIRVFNKVNI